MFTFQTWSKPKEDQWVVSLSPLKVLIRYKRDTGQEGEAALRIDLNCRQRDRGGKRAGGEGEEGGTRERRTRAATQARAATAPEEKRERGREREAEGERKTRHAKETREKGTGKGKGGGRGRPVQASCGQGRGARLGWRPYRPCRRVCGGAWPRILDVFKKRQ